MNELPSAWLSAIEGLPAVHARLRRVVIVNDDAVKIIGRGDGPRTLYYCDPPYRHETRTTTDEYGQHEMQPADHERLLKMLLIVEGRFLLSGYPSQHYDSFARRCGWRCHKRKIDNKASGRRTKQQRTECVWTNY